jgi:hypothetical protein
VPWCDDCNRFLTPTTLRADGACPTCGRVVAEAPSEEEELRAPWHFKLLVAMAGAYLAWRAVQLVAALV